MKPDPKRRVTPAVPVPHQVAKALERSADDLAHERIEDSSGFLERMEARIDRYRARRRQLAGVGAGLKERPDHS